MDDRRTPTAEMFIRQRELNHFRVSAEDRVHRAAQIANAFAVNDSHTKNTALLALGEIIQHERLDVTRLKRVKIEHAVYWHLDGFIGHAQ